MCPIVFTRIGLKGRKTLFLLLLLLLRDVITAHDYETMSLLGYPKVIPNSTEAKYCQ